MHVLNDGAWDGSHDMVSPFGSTSGPWVFLVINVNISLVGLTKAWHGQEDVEPLQEAKDKDWQKLKTLHFNF